MPAEPWEPAPVITAAFEDGTVKELFSYFPDEISFLPGELVGLTEAETRALKSKKDKTYLGRGFRLAG